MYHIWSPEISSADSGSLQELEPWLVAVAVSLVHTPSKLVGLAANRHHWDVLLMSEAWKLYVECLQDQSRRQRNASVSLDTATDSKITHLASLQKVHNIQCFPSSYSYHTNL